MFNRAFFVRQSFKTFAVTLFSTKHIVGHCDTNHTDIIEEKLPDNFVSLSSIDSSILHDIRNFNGNNLMKKRLKSYEAPNCILYIDAARALARVQKNLHEKGYELLIFDCYRPQAAIQETIEYLKESDDPEVKKRYYPKIDKNLFFKLDYMTLRSSHSRGIAVDLTLIDIKTKKALDMGTEFFFLGEETHTNYPGLTEEQKNNRKFLNEVMTAEGFKNYHKEWWHFNFLCHTPSIFYNAPVVAKTNGDELLKLKR